MQEVVEEEIVENIEAIEEDEPQLEEYSSKTIQYNSITVI